MPLNDTTINLIKDGLMIYGVYKALKEIVTAPFRGPRPKKIVGFSTLTDLSQAFFEGTLASGTLVEFPARFSKYGYIYSPKSLYRTQGESESLSYFDDRSNPNKPRYFTINSDGSKSEHFGPVIYPPYPTGVLPEIREESFRFAVGFVYPLTSRGTHRYITDSCRCIPVIYAREQDLDSFSDTIVTLRARVIDLPDTLLHRLVLNNPGVAKALLSFYYRPANPVRKGLCLSMLDSDGAPDEATAIRVSLSPEEASLMFRMSYFVEGHLETCDFRSLAGAQKDKLYDELQESIVSTFMSEKVLTASDGFVSLAYTDTEFQMQTPSLVVGVLSPNRFYCVASIDQITEYIDKVSLLQETFRSGAKAIADVCSAFASTNCSFCLDFLSDYRMQYAFSDHGVLASAAARCSTEGDDDLEDTRKWLSEPT